MSITEFPFDPDELQREIDNVDEEQREAVADTVSRIVTKEPSKGKSGAPNLLDLRGILREDGDERARPGTTQLRESRELDERKDRELLDRLQSDE